MTVDRRSRLRTLVIALLGGDEPRARAGWFSADAGILVMGAFALLGIVGFIASHAIEPHGVTADARMRLLVLGCGGMLVVSAALILERLRWDRASGRGPTLDERFRWIDDPDAERRHEGAALPALPTRVRALRPLAYALQYAALVAGLFLSMDAWIVLWVPSLSQFLLAALRAWRASTPGTETLRSAGAAPPIDPSQQRPV